jgi:N utilization substance protein A
MPKLIARTEFASALNQLATERGISVEAIIESIKSAILAAYKKELTETGQEVKEDYEFSAHLDPATGESRIFCWPAGQEDQKQDCTPPGFGRIAAQTAKNVILQKIREAEKSAVITEYVKRVGQLTPGMVLRLSGSNVIVDLGKSEAVMPPKEQVPSEDYQLNQRMTFYIEGVHETPKGDEIVLSRAHPQLIELLFAREVPEVNSGAVEIKSVAREPGSRTKIAVYSNQSGVDPIGSCVGQKGIRVQAVINEVNGEKIDIVQYSDVPEELIKATLAPADTVSVTVNEKDKSALVIVPDDQLSLAIGKNGQNVRLAAKLTGYKLDIQGQTAKAKTSPTPPSSKAKPPTAPSDLDALSTRTQNLLKNASITTLDQLKAKSPGELKAVKGLGPKSLEEIKKLTSR